MPKYIGNNAVAGPYEKESSNSRQDRMETNKPSPRVIGVPRMELRFFPGGFRG